jgi:hypothetical protein
MQLQRWPFVHPLWPQESGAKRNTVSFGCNDIRSGRQSDPVRIEVRMAKELLNMGL